jgi:hypothetical protein
VARIHRSAIWILRPIADHRLIALHPGNWEDPMALDWLLKAFDQVRAFYQGAASRGNAVLLYVT